MAAPMNSTLIKFFSSLHRFWYRLSGGRIGGRINGMDVLLLTTKGRKSGKTRTTPLMFLPEGDAYVVVASNAGHDRHPAWWLNISSNPQANVRVRSSVRTVRAQEASAEERARLWPKLTELYADYAKYEQMTSRRIPVVILRPEQVR